MTNNPPIDDLFIDGECSHCGTITTNGDSICYNCGREIPSIVITKAAIKDLIVQEQIKARIAEAEYIQEHANDDIIADCWAAYDTWLGNRIATLNKSLEEK